MTLSALIRKRDPGKVATAIPAIFATQPVEVAATVARIATVAVANSPSPKTASMPEPAVEAANVSEVFCFSPPVDPTNDDEALQERVAIMMEGNGWDAARALQEARWAADRERCWRAFLRNAQRVLEAPAHKRDVLLTLYQVEAARRYGQAAAVNMACGLRAWVKARGVH
jgi:hypothetical protein